MVNQYAAMMRKGEKLPPEAKPGRRYLAAYKPTDKDREIVRVLAGNGVTEPVMCKVLGICKSTLDKYFQEEMTDGREMVTAWIGAALVAQAMEGNVAAQRYWLGTHGGPDWRIPKPSELMPDIFDDDDPRAERSEHVHFFLPSNHRDEPETIDEDPPVIDGEAEDQAA